MQKPDLNNGMSTVTAALKSLRETDFVQVADIDRAIGAVLTAHTTAGLCYILAQTLWRYVVYHWRAFIAYCKQPFANFVKTCVQMTVVTAAITVNMLTLWASAFAAEITEKQLEKHADTDVHNQSIGLMQATNNLLSIAVAITSIGYCMHMFASNNPFVSGVWQFACSVALFGTRTDGDAHQRDTMDSLEQLEVKVPIIAQHTNIRSSIYHQAIADTTTLSRWGPSMVS